MAIIKCENCGAEISDRAFECPKCGCSVQARKTKPALNRKQLIAVFAIIGVLIAVILGRTIYNAVLDSRFDDSELYVLDCVETLIGEKGRISLNGDILYSVENERTFVVVEYSSYNGRSIAYFMNREYLGDESDYISIEDYDIDDVRSGRISEEEYSEILERCVGFSYAKKQVAKWNLNAAIGSSGDEGIHLVSAKKIGNKLGLSYPK